MKQTLFAFLIIASSLIISCEKENTTAIGPLYIVSVDMPDSVAFGQVCDYTIHGNLPTPCHWFYRKEQSSNGNNIYIKTLSKFRLDEYCSDVVVPIDVPGHFNFTGRGTYFIHFWQSDTTFLDKTLTVY